MIIGVHQKSVGQLILMGLIKKIKIQLATYKMIF